ncbi:MAG TPA: cytochrome b N-terminal domain-containing protein, partial [Myxococcota bacterium]|nr:cytochrome b N-terminal domain-containing protein [Myxococcota bacterium]
MPERRAGNAPGGWLAARTGAPAWQRALAAPARGRWWWLGAAIVVGFAVQAATGALLLVYYVPHPDHAFASAHGILWDVPFGWAVRLFHAHGASALLLLGVAHTAVSAARADYKAPRELVWVCGRALLLLAFAAAISGYVLPWSQLSYWATTITIAPLDKLPGIGPTLAALARGGPAVGAPTLSRAFVAHVLLLPALAAGGLVLYVWLLRQAPAPGAAPGRPAARAVELARIAVAYGALLLALSVFAPGLAFPPHADAPADPLETPYPIRPEWYLLWASALQSLLPEIAGLGIVALLPLLLLAVPFLDRGPERSPRRRPVALAVLAAVLFALALLTAAGARADEPAPSQCIACHEADEDEYVSDCVPEWRASVHAAAEVSCDGCHGGDPHADGEDDAHDEAAGWIGTPRWRDVPAFCGACHEEVSDGYAAGAFGPARFAGGAFPPSCATCHMASGHDTGPADARELLPDPLPQRLRLAPAVAEMQALVLPLADRERALDDALAAL